PAWFRSNIVCGSSGLRLYSPANSYYATQCATAEQAFIRLYSRPLKESMSDSLEYLMIHVAECSFVTHGAAVDSRTTSSGATVRCTAAKSLESRSAAAASSNRVTATDPIITRG